MSFTMPGLPLTGNKRAGRNWRAIHAIKKRWRRDAGLAAIAAGKPSSPLTKAEISFTRYSSKEIDLDNLAISFKEIQDSLVDSGIIIDDSPQVVTIIYAWQKCAPKKGCIKVEVRGQ